MYKAFQIPRILFDRFRDEKDTILSVTRNTPNGGQELHRIVSVKSERNLTVSYYECDDKKSGRRLGFFSAYSGFHPDYLTELIRHDEADLMAVRTLHIRCGPYVSPHDTDRNCVDRITIDFPNGIQIDKYGGWIDTQIFKMAGNAVELWNGAECVKEEARLAAATA